MNQTLDIVSDALSNATPELKDVLSPKTPAPVEGGDSSSLFVTSDGGSGTNDKSRANLQVVDEHQTFTNELDRHMKDWNLADKGFAYDVVAVFGSQSTGKSTLLNRLFGTKFDVMNESERRQTTKGIWMSKGEEMSVLVMDVEGTDGRERGEDQDFERKSALFSMAVAEVLIVNIWEHQVGLYQGANMGLLKTVFEVNLGLFLAAKEKGKSAGTSQDKTLLLFVIRDYIGATPLANLKATLTADLNRLWDGLSKPSGLEDCQITTFFDLSFVTLAHKLLQPQEFENQVRTLRKRFVEPTNEDYVFQPKYHKRIPADGISTYMLTIWDAVVTNKDLDLPTQQELLAQFRCDEIANGAFLLFVEAIKSFVPSTAEKLNLSLGRDMSNVRFAALEAFDSAASRYHSGVYHRKRIELLDKLNAALYPFVQSYLKNLHKIVLKRFRKKVQDGLKVDGYDFAKVVEGTKKEAETEFEAGAKEVILDQTNWSAEESSAQLKEDMVAIADLLRAEETKKMIALIERNIKKQVSETIEMSLNKPSVDMWDRILIAFKTALSKAEETYVRKATGFNCTPEENETALALLRQRAWLATRAKIDEQTAESVLLVKLKLVFEERFRYDEEGTPRVWKPEDDIDSIFKKAKEEVLALIPLYATISPSNPVNAFTLPSSSVPTSSSMDDLEFDFDSTLTILREAQSDALATRFRREADAYYLEAKRSMVSSISQIPVWMYGVLAILGWNEFIAVLKSPIYFTMLLLAASAAYITVHLGMTGPVFAVAKGVSNEVVKTVNDQLHNYFTNQTAEAHASRQPVAPHTVEPTPPRNLRATIDGEAIELKSMSEKQKDE